QQWESGMCSCCSNWKVCCLGLWCPCMLYARTHRRIRSNPSKVGSGFSHCNTACVQYCCGGGIMAARQRSEIRYRYNLPGSECGDVWRHCCCGPCSLCQEEREVRAREHMHRELQQAGYEKNPGMVYG
ncbi:PLAC8-domain-containing protein, partial [Ascodesmis nigricans]